MGLSPNMANGSCEISVKPVDFVLLTHIKLIQTDGVDTSIRSLAQLLEWPIFSVRNVAIVGLVMNGTGPTATFTSLNSPAASRYLEKPYGFSHVWGKISGPPAVFDGFPLATLLVSGQRPRTPYGNIEPPLEIKHQREWFPVNCSEP